MAGVLDLVRLLIKIGDGGPKDDSDKIAERLALM
jgi:hypothetical protein